MSTSIVQGMIRPVTNVQFALQTRQDSGHATYKKQRDLHVGGKSGNDYRLKDNDKVCTKLKTYYTKMLQF